MSLDQWERTLGSWALPATDPPSASTHQPNSTINAASAAGSSIVPTAYLDSIEQSAMACEFETLLNHGQYEHGLEHARDAMRVIHALEDQLTVYRPTSDLSTINRWGAERAVAASYDVCRLLSVAREVSQLTGRAFDITAGMLSEVWGFSRRAGRKPDESELAAAIACVGADLVQVDMESLTVKLSKTGVRLNSGGIGKGYALDSVARGLCERGVEDFLLHGGRSSIAARGDRHFAESQDAVGGWWIALAHPLRWEEKLGRVRLSNQALGTSGAGKQFFHYQGVRYSHVIDPRTGWPAQGVLSATAISRSGTLADAFATAFMVMGVEATRQFCAQHPTLSAILVSTPEGSSRLAIDLINIAPEDWRESRSL